MKIIPFPDTERSSRYNFLIPNHLVPDYQIPNYEYQVHFLILIPHPSYPMAYPINSIITPFTQIVLDWDACNKNPNSILWPLPE
jgi:hypothetical protein